MIKRGVKWREWIRIGYDVLRKLNDLVMENESLLLWVENGRALAHSESNKFRILDEIECAFAPQKRSKLAWRSSDYFEQKRIIRASGPFPRRPARLVSEDREKAFCGGVIRGQRAGNN